MVYFLISYMAVGLLAWVWLIRHVGVCTIRDVLIGLPFSLVAWWLVPLIIYPDVKLWSKKK